MIIILVYDSSAQGLENQQVISSAGSINTSGSYTNFCIVGQHSAGLFRSNDFLNEVGFLYKADDGYQIKVYTEDVTKITTRSAQGNGYIFASDNLSLIGRGVCWSTEPNPTINDNFKSQGRQPGDFKARISEITTGTTYYVRAFAQTADAVFYGENVSFTTPSAKAIFNDEIDFGVDLSVLVYPNPASDYITINMNLKEKADINITITNLLGIEVYKQTKYNIQSVSENISIQELPKGTYFVAIKYNEKQLYQKLIKN